MGKLDNIIARNKRPRLAGDRIAVGMTSLVVLVVVILLIITLLRPAPPPKPAPAAENPRVPVRLYRVPSDAGPKPP